jgi:hypothetical protein
MQRSSRPRRTATTLHSPFSSGVTSVPRRCSPRSSWETATKPTTSCSRASPSCIEVLGVSTARVPFRPGSSRSSAASRRTGGCVILAGSDCFVCGREAPASSGLLRHPTTASSRESTRLLLHEPWSLSLRCSERASSWLPFEISRSKRWRQCTASANPRSGSMSSARVRLFVWCSTETQPVANRDAFKRTHETTSP